MGKKNNLIQENRHWVETEEMARQRIKQAHDLKEQAGRGGLRFQAYLPPELAEWVLNMVEKGVFVDPSEAVFKFMRQAQDIEPHDDIKREILKRSLEAAEKDIKKGRLHSEEETMTEINEMAEDNAQPAVWHKTVQEA